MMIKKEKKMRSQGLVAVWAASNDFREYKLGMTSQIHNLVEQAEINQL